MQKNVYPLEKKLASEGRQPYLTATALTEISQKIHTIKVADLAVDILPLFEQRTYVMAWLEGFHQNFDELVKNYI